MSLFETLYCRVLEWTVLGEPVQALLARETTVCRKTWDAGGPKRPSLKAKALVDISKASFQRMRDKGSSEEEIKTWLARFPETTEDEPYFLSMIIRLFSLSDEPPPETIALANKMDELAHAIWKAGHSRDIATYKDLLLNTPLLDKCYFADTERELRVDDVPLAYRQAQIANDWAELSASSQAVMVNMLLSFLASWDLEFCRDYAPAMKPFPLYEILMLQTTHDLESNPKLPSRRDLFRFPTRKLIDLMAMMGEYIRNHGGKTLKKIPVKDMEAWLELGEPQIPAQKLWNWRRGRDAFLLEDLAVVWRRFAGARDDNEKNIPPPPIPLFVVASIWQHVQFQDNKKAGRKTLLFIQPWYLWWWEHHRDRLMAKGITWGNRPWPACIINQTSWSGVKTSDSNLSSQSSGRSSKSRDSQ